MITVLEERTCSKTKKSQNKKEQIEKKYTLQSRGYDLNKVANRVSQVLRLELSEVWAPGRERKRVEARSLLCYWAVREVGLTMTQLSKRLQLSLSAVSLAVKRGEHIAQEKGYRIRSD